MEIPIDEDQLRAKQFAVTGFDRATEYVAGQAPEDAKQRTNADGVPLWEIFCTEQAGRRVTNFKVRIASVSPPAIEGISRIHFGGLRATIYPDRNRNMVSFTADTFALGDPPSAARKTPPTPEGGAKAA